ncbi:F-box domain-containing protein [Mycena kentingensis (nom. inval.)]|nr:F-box domain-containing protein [Mycena kentingensis (nom. inval.)]
MATRDAAAGIRAMKPAYIQKMPLELLSDIFKLSIAEPRHAMLDGVSVGLRRPAPWSLGHVCRSWRATTLGYPALWNTLLVKLTTDAAAVEEQLLRAGARDADAPLYVCFDLRSLPDVPQSVLDLIIPTSKRWVGLQLRNAQLIVLRPPSSHDDWIAGLAGKLPRLERLEIFNCGSWQPPKGVFTTAPRLTRVLTTCAGTGRDELSPSVDLPWAQLTHYCGAVDDPMGYLPHLSLAANTLVECVLGGPDRPRDEDNHPNSILFLPRLRRLHLVEGKLLEYITTPELQDLCLWSNTRGLQDHEFRTLVPFLQRSGCALRSLVLARFNFGPSLTADLLNAVPLLEELRVEGAHSYSQDRIFDALERCDSVPCLRQLTYGYQKRLMLKEAVLAAVTARVPTMQTLLLYEVVGDPISEEDPWIREVKELGVDVKCVSLDDALIERKCWGDYEYFSSRS